MLLLLVLSSVGCNQSDKEDLSLTRGKVGPIEIGMAIDSIYGEYERRSVQLVDSDLEGSPSPALEIYREKSGDDNDPSLVVEIDQSEDGQPIVGRITVFDSSFRTSAGVGVTSTLGTLKEAHYIASIVAGEGGPYALVPDLGMSFALDISVSDVPPDWYKTANPRLIPDDAKVSRILVADK